MLRQYCTQYAWKPAREKWKNTNTAPNLTGKKLSLTPNLNVDQREMEGLSEGRRACIGKTGLCI